MHYALEHLHIMCRNLETGIAYLTDVFGARLLRRRTAGKTPAPVADLQLGGLVIFLRQVEDDWAPADPRAKVCGYSHLGFLVDNLDAALEELVARPDTRLVGEPFFTGEKRCAFITGPDGLYIEIMQLMNRDI